MSLKSILSSTITYLFGLSKKGLVKALILLRDKYLLLAEQNKELEQENERLLSQLIKQKVQQVNKGSNQPSSKQPEWEEKGVGNDGKGKKKGRGKKGRKGAGNNPKNLIPTKKELAEVERCTVCDRDLSGQQPVESHNIRIIEDIPELPVALEVIEVIQEKKYCRHCKKTITAKSGLALPKSDFGLNTTVAMVYYWIYSCLSLPRISACLNDFFSLKISTPGISKHLIRTSKILTPVYDQILENIKSCKVLQADETGWRVSGKNWWLWVFGTEDWAFYTIDASRGKDVVRRVLGEIFTGVLVVDGWRAYLSLECEQQSCMAHLLRKIRKLYAAFPELSSVHSFYIKFRKILRDGERLQDQRKTLGEIVFKRRLDKLHFRLDRLLEWLEPNDILKDIIKKTKLQRPRILTFVAHQDVPCHNNYGEYLIRIGVLKRKISSGSKSKEGAQAYAVLLSIYTTCKLQDIPFLDFIKQSLKHYISTGCPMLLKNYQKPSKLPMAA